MTNVKNITNSRGRAVPNQFIIASESKEIFQSYNSVIAIKEGGKVILDEIYWDYSNTTGKYRNQFLSETKKETERKIKEGVYTLANLN